MYLTQKEQKDVVVKKAKHGKGVFALHAFKPEQKIVRIQGRFITCDLDEDIDDEERSNAFRFDADLYISPKNRIGNFFNHSCEPNAKVIKKDNKLFMIATSPIQKGDEVFFDYSTVIASDDIWTMKCGCGSYNCRGVVKQFQKLPKRIKEAYLKKGIVPRYILKY